MYSPGSPVAEAGVKTKLKMSSAEADFTQDVEANGQFEAGNGDSANGAGIDPEAAAAGEAQNLGNAEDAQAAAEADAAAQVPKGTDDNGETDFVYIT